MTIGTAAHKRSKLLKIGGRKGNGPGIDLPSGNRALGLAVWLFRPTAASLRTHQSLTA